MGGSGAAAVGVQEDVGGSGLGHVGAVGFGLGGRPQRSGSVQSMSFGHGLGLGLGLGFGRVG